MPGNRDLKKKKARTRRVTPGLFGPLIFGLTVSLVAWAFTRPQHSEGNMVSPKSDRPIGIQISGNAHGNKFYGPEFNGNMDAVKIDGQASNNKIYDMKVNAPDGKKPTEHWYGKPLGVVFLGVLGSLLAWWILRFFNLS